MTESERHELLARLALGDLTPVEADCLLRACQEDPAFAAECARLVAVERLLYAVGSDPTGELAAREVVTRIRHAQTPVPAAHAMVRAVEAAHRLLWWRRLTWAGSVFAVLAVLIGGALFWKVRENRPVATLVRVEGVRWKGEDPAKALHAGARLIARRGLFELRFANGTHVVVEAPADIELQGAGRAFLHGGRVVARVPERGRGFTLDSPRGPVVDLGTEFGVAVGPNGNTEVHVLDGIVEASLNQSTPVLLHEREGLRATSHATERLQADERAFVTSLPPVAKTPPGFIHWNFDEEDGARIFANTGRWLGAEGDTRLFSRFLETAGRSGPALKPGKYGKALVFDGINDYAESPFPGITEGHARTIAFWVKVPRRFSVAEGYGIVSWGDIHQEGAAWQISANPIPENGELGRLRIGTKSGYVIGTTDLRDDQWHHCAIVMYGGQRPNTGTHILLYLDGELEPCPRKSVQDIATKPSPAHGVWVGRNLAFHADTAEISTGGRFFRGSVDELYIFNGALSQRDIETLMRENLPPEV